MDCYKPSHLVSITKELQNINKNLQSINQTLNQMETVSRFTAGLITANNANLKFKYDEMELKRYADLLREEPELKTHEKTIT